MLSELPRHRYLAPLSQAYECLRRIKLEKMWRVTVPPVARKLRKAAEASESCFPEQILPKSGRNMRENHGKSLKTSQKPAKIDVDGRFS